MALKNRAVNYIKPYGMKITLPALVAAPKTTGYSIQFGKNMARTSPFFAPICFNPWQTLVDISEASLYFMESPLSPLTYFTPKGGGWKLKEL